MKRSGFTLIEILISLLILGIILPIFFFSISAYIKNYHKISGKIETIQIAQNILRQISDSVRNAKEIKSVAAQKIELDDLTYEFKEQKVKRIKGKGSAYLTNKGEIEDLAFESVKPKLVGIYIKTKSFNMETKVFCRN